MKRMHIDRLSARRPGRPSDLRPGFLVLALALAGGCSYQPPASADRNSAKFQADLAECRQTGDKLAHHAVISRFPLFITYPVSLPLKRRAAIRSCMEAKGTKRLTGVPRRDSGTPPHPNLR